MRRRPGHQGLGQDQRGLLSLGGQPRARTALTAFAHNARMQSAWAGRLYADARARGKRNPHATRIVARAWLRVIWACWHTNTPYDPCSHLAQQRLTAA
jgi:transposase